MDSTRLQHSSELTRALARVVEAGGVAVLATLVEAGRGVGAKVLFEAEGARTGTTGDAALDGALEERARAFLDSRAEARTLRAEEFAPRQGEYATADFAEFEEEEKRPRRSLMRKVLAGCVTAGLLLVVCYVSLLETSTAINYEQKQVVLRAVLGLGGHVHLRRYRLVRRRLAALGGENRARRDPAVGQRAEDAA